MTIWQAIRQFFGNLFSRIKKLCIEHPVLVTVGTIVFLIFVAVIAVFLIKCPRSPFKKGSPKTDNSNPEPPTQKPEGDKNVTIIMPAFKILAFGMPPGAFQDIQATATTINSLLDNLQELNFTSEVFAVKQKCEQIKIHELNGKRYVTQNDLVQNSDHMYEWNACKVEKRIRNDIEENSCPALLTNKTCKEGEVCFIRYAEGFQSVVKKGCTRKEKYDLTLKEDTFFCSEDWCNDPSKYIDVTGELAQPVELKCYSSTDGTISNLTTCPSDSKYCVVKVSLDSVNTPTKIIERFCGNQKEGENGVITLKQCQKNGCNNVALRSCYYGVAKTCDLSFEYYLSLASNGVQIKNCKQVFYPNVCVTRKLVSSDGKTCMVHDCHHLEADHLLHFKRNPTAKELVVKDGNITMTIIQCTEENCNEPSERFKGIKCWVLIMVTRVKKFCVDHPVLLSVATVVSLIIVIAIVVLLLKCPCSPFNKGSGKNGNSNPERQRSKPKDQHDNTTNLPTFNFKIITFGLPSKALDDISATVKTINALVESLQTMNLTSGVFVVKQSCEQIKVHELNGKRYVNENDVAQNSDHAYEWNACKTETSERSILVLPRCQIFKNQQKCREMQLAVQESNDLQINSFATAKQLKELMDKVKESTNFEFFVADNLEL
uniref:Envelope protein n=1 Tax=Panagrolaimus sp. JU765 TaxID=591449 RepID=A0AC34QZ15_9BILA